jgi:hypothetical protein
MNRRRTYEPIRKRRHRSNECGTAEASVILLAVTVVSAVVAILFLVNITNEWAIR